MYEAYFQYNCTLKDLAECISVYYFAVTTTIKGIRMEDKKTILGYDDKKFRYEGDKIFS